MKAYVESKSTFAYNLSQYDSLKTSKKTEA